MSHLHKMLRLRISTAINFTSKYVLMANVDNFIYLGEKNLKMPLSHLARELWNASILALGWHNRKWNLLTVLQYVLWKMFVPARMIHKCKNVERSKLPTNKHNSAEIPSKTFPNHFEIFSTWLINKYKLLTRIYL